MKLRLAWLELDCGDCDELSFFLQSSERSGCDWPLNKQRRRHIHGVLDSNDLPVRHTTLRRGSPHVLQLRKDQSLASRERDHQRKLKSMLSGFKTESRSVKTIDPSGLPGGPFKASFSGCAERDAFAKP